MESSFAAAAKALEHLLRAHTEAAWALASRPGGGRAGIAHNMLDFAPDRPGSVLDRRLAAARAKRSTTSLSSKPWRPDR